MFGSQEFEVPLRHSANSRMLHNEHDIILTNNLQHQPFHQPNTRKITKITPKENHSSIKSRSTNVVPLKNETKLNIPTPSTDVQRLKNVRRHEPAHVPSASVPNKNLITPDSWKHYPVVLKTPVVKKPPTEIPAKKIAKIEEKRAPSIEPLPAAKKPKTERPKRARSQSKPAEPVPPKKPEKTEEEKEKIRKYIQEKRQEQEKLLLNEKQQRLEQEKQRKEKLKQLNEQIKKVAQQPLAPTLVKKINQTQLTAKDPTEQTRERLIEILGPRIVHQPPTEIHLTTPFEELIERERSSSESSSSSESVVEIQPPEIKQTISHLPSGTEQRQQNILRWAMNLTRDCGNIETKFKFLRPDGTQPFDLIPSSQSNLKLDDGNLRSPIPFVIKNEHRREPEVKTPSKLLRPSGRLTNLNRNQASEYENEQLPGVGNLRDPMLEQRVKRDRAATKIQSAYRGYTVRKSLQWIHDEPQRQTHDFNKRSTRKPTKITSYSIDTFDKPALNLEIPLSDDKFTIGSTLLRQFQRNGINIISPPVIEQPKAKVKTPEPRVQKSSSLRTYSDDYENIPSSRTSTPIKQRSASEKLQPTKSRTSDTESTATVTTTSSSSSTTPPPPVAPQRRRSISPPPPPRISPDNGRAKTRSPVPSSSRRVFDERRYSPDALERQLNAELHLLDGVEASMKQIENMERLRSVALAQQEVVSLAQILKNKPTNDIPSQQSNRKSSSSTISSSSSSHRKRHSDTQSSTSSSETILTAREKRFRQKYHNDAELKAYEKRLHDVEKKIRVLVKRATDMFDDQKTPVQSPRKSSKSDNDSSINEDIPVSNRSSSSTSSTVQRKPIKDTSEIYTETFEKDTDSASSTSSPIQQPKSETITTDVSELERRINTYHTQLKTKKAEFDKLKQRKTRDDLRRQENELKKQLENYNKQIDNMQRKEKTAPARISPIKTTNSSSSSSSGSSTPTKQHESSIAEELPAVSTASHSKSEIIKEKERDFFDDDDDDELPQPKKPEIKPLETPRDERDTQHDAQSISIATDIGGSSETEPDDSRRPSTDNEKSILKFNTIIPPPLQSKDPSSSSSSSSSRTSTPSKKSPKASSIVRDYDEDFSEDSRSPSTPAKVTEIDVESIQEDLEDKPTPHSTTQSASSKSSDDEQSEILVLNKKSASTTPRLADERTFEEDLLPPVPVTPQVRSPSPPNRIEINANDDTSHDISEDEEVIEQETKADKLTDLFLRTFIDEAIDQGKEIKRLKKEADEKKHLLTQEAKEWVSEDEDLTDDENPRLPEPIESNELAIDLSGLNDKSGDDGPLSTARKGILEEPPIEILVPHSREQVSDLTQQAVRILFEQNTNFADREAVRVRIPDSYFQQESDVEDVRLNHRAYCQMIMDLSVELLHELYSDNIEPIEYPEWQKARLVPKRFTRGRKPQTRQEAEKLVEEKILEILNLNSRSKVYSKWRVTPNRRSDIDKFETILDEEIRRTESQWINYDHDCTQLKFDIADSIFDQLVQETLTDCLTVVNKRFYLSSNSTRF